MNKPSLCYLHGSSGTISGWQGKNLLMARTQLVRCKDGWWLGWAAKAAASKDLQVTDVMSKKQSWLFF